jgi:hypothetical protein
MVLVIVLSEINQQRGTPTMRTTPHAYPTERIALPRRLVPRRPAKVVADTFRAIHNAPATLFSTGDLIQFEDAAGSRRWILILDICCNGHVDAAVYDGRPHYVAITLGDLLKLRIVCVERMESDDVAMYCRMLKRDLPAHYERVEADRLEVAA